MPKRIDQMRAKFFPGQLVHGLANGFSIVGVSIKSALEKIIVRHAAHVLIVLENIEPGTKDTRGLQYLFDASGRNHRARRHAMSELRMFREQREHHPFFSGERTSIHTERRELFE